MSRGPGRVERTILSLGRTPLLVTQIARRAYQLAHAADVTATHCQAVRRALRKFERVGVVERVADEALRRWRWQGVDVAAAERFAQRRQRALERQWQREQRRAAVAKRQAAVAAREAAIRTAENVTAIGDRKTADAAKPAEPLTLATREEMRMRRPPLVRMTRRRSQRPGSIGQLWVVGIEVPQPEELPALIARIARLWAGLHEANPDLAHTLLAHLPKTKIFRADQPARPWWLGSDR